jgi:SAM-dependent methyltransferase
MKSLYNEDYFEHGIENNISCYTNYRWIPELTIPMAARLIEFLRISENETVLDFGCAKGFLVYAFRLLHRNAFGYDISEYAISQSPKEVSPYIFNALNDVTYDWIISKDVFEHIHYEEIDKTLQKLSSICKKMFCIVPLGEEGKYFVPAYELDKTHIIKENLNWWSETFSKSGFVVDMAAYNVEHIKSNWKSWDKGNGFFILEKGEI